MIEKCRPLEGDQVELRRSGVGLNEVRHPCHATRPLLRRHNGAAMICAYGNCSLCCRRLGVLLVFAPLASLSLAGDDHEVATDAPFLTHRPPVIVAIVGGLVLAFREGAP